MTARWPLRIAAYLVCVFVATPIIVVVASSFTAKSYIGFPPEGLTLKWYREVLTDRYVIDSLRVSLIVAVVTAMAAASLGLGVGFALERHRFYGKQLVNAIIMAPITLPSIVLAIGMIYFMTSVGLIRTIPGLIAGHLVVTLPYAVRAISASLSGVDRDLERSASILGAPPVIVLYRVTLPQIMPGIVAALMFSFLASFNNVVISLFIAGPRTQTLPLTMFRMAETSLSPTLSAISSVVIGFTTAVMLLLEKKFGMYSLLEKGRSL